MFSQARGPKTLFTASEQGTCKKIFFAWSSVSARCCQKELETRTTKHAGIPNLVCSSAPLANPNEAQVPSRRQGAAKTQKQDIDTGTRRSHKAHDSCSDINGASCQGGSEGHRGEFRNTLRPIGLASWSSTPRRELGAARQTSQSLIQKGLCSFQLLVWAETVTIMAGFFPDSLRSSKCLGVTVAIMAGRRPHGAQGVTVAIMAGYPAS